MAKLALLVCSMLWAVAAAQEPAAVDLVPETLPEPAAEERKPAARPHEPRAGEVSESRIPAADSRAPSDYERLRDQVASVRDPRTVESSLAAFVAAHPQHRDARVLLGRVQILAGKQLAAIETLAAILTPSHPDWQPWFWTGTAYLSMGEVELARQNLDVALGKSSDNAELWVQMAVLEQELDNHAGALQYLAIAEQLDPRAAQTHLNRAYSLERLGRFEEALQAYQHFLVSDMEPASVALRPTVLKRIAAIAGELQAGRRAKRYEPS